VNTQNRFNGKDILAVVFAPEERHVYSPGALDNDSLRQERHVEMLVHCAPNIVGASLRGRPILDSLGNKLQKPRRWGAHGGTPLQIKTPVYHVAKSYKDAAPLEHSR
jgi:hypothetical protein